MSRQHDDDPGALFGAPLCVAGWQVRLAAPADHPAIQALRAQAFRGNPASDDHDAFDAGSLHLWIGQPDGQGSGAGPRATVRLRLHRSAEDLLSGYAAQYYDLAALANTTGPILELGRLCRAPSGGRAGPDGDILRLIWAGVARVALNSRATRLIGCTSFATTAPGALGQALDILAARHLGPAPLRPGVKAPEVHRLGAPVLPPDPAAAGGLPPLLRLYLMLGGWVSDHLVIDRDLGTSHIFTCVDIDTMPAARKRVLAAMAAP